MYSGRSSSSTFAYELGKDPEDHEVILKKLKEFCFEEANDTFVRINSRDYTLTFGCCCFFNEGELFSISFNF